MDILKIEHLSKTYGKGEASVKALDDVSFTVKKGHSSPSSLRRVWEINDYAHVWWCVSTNKWIRNSLLVWLRPYRYKDVNNYT
jgi:hypothetical protein